MTQRLYRTAHRCARHGRLVLAIWILVAIAVVGTNHALGPKGLNNYVLQGTDSATAQQLLSDAFPGTSTQANPLVLYNPDVDFGTSPGTDTINTIATELLKNPAIATVATPAQQPNQLSSDHHTAIINVVVADTYVGQESVAYEVLETGQKYAGPGTQVALGGLMGQQISKPSTEMSEVIGLIAAIIVLFFTLRRWPAVLIPILNALIAVAIGLNIIQLLGRVVFIPDVAPTLGTMLGLGVGIDYALFLVTRHRRLLRAGYEVTDSAGRTAGTAGAGTVFAGGTLIAAVCGLTFTGISFLAWLGYAAGIVVAIAMLSSLTLVPAMFGLFGQRVLPKKERESDLVHGDHEALDRTFWARLAHRVTEHPWHYVIGSTALLCVLAAPAFTLTVGVSDAGTLPKDTTARQANDLMVSGFGPGSTDPFAIVVQMFTVATAPTGANGQPVQGGAGNSSDPRTLDPRLTQLQQTLEQTPGVSSVGSPVVSTDGGVAVIRANPSTVASDPATQELVRELRDTTLPDVTAGQSEEAHVGGVTAATNDLMDLIAERTPYFILGVVLLAFVLLMIAYRSLLIPFKAAVMNLISIAAAYGVITVIFQWGWGIQLIGLEGPVPIDSYVPMMMFAVLFGLSMDYEVFLLTAFREHAAHTDDMRTAVRRGLADTGQLVTSAALIMVSVFASFILSDDATVKIFGVGLSTAVLVDATIVRCLLVPAIMVLAQKGTWWLPGWLDRLLPQLHVEGDPEALDAAAASAAAPASGRRPMAFHRPAAVIAAVIGVALAILTVSNLPTMPPNSSTAVTVSAILGAVVVLLPAGFAGGSGSRPIRALGFAIGVVLGAVVVGFFSGVIPPLRQQDGVVTAWAVLIVGLVVLLVASRKIAMPMMMGTVSLATTVLVLSDIQPSTPVMLGAALIPALVVIVFTSIIIAFTGDRPIDGDDGMDGTQPLAPAASEQSAPIDHDKADQDVGATPQ